MSRTRRWQPLLVLASATALAAAGCAAGAGSTPTWTFNPTPIASAVAVATPAPTPTPGPTITYPTIDFTPGTVAAPRQVDVTADDDLNFSPSVIVVAQGETVSFKITTIGKAVHEFMIGPADAAFTDTEGTPELENLKKGHPQTLTFTFDGPGPFAFACHEPGHFEHGMKGWIIVVGPDVPKVGTVANPRLVHIDMSDKLKFDPSSVVVAPGETIRFLITNSGEATHELALGPADKVAADQIDGKLVVEADEIDAGLMKDLVYTFDGPGPYGFACHEPGHFEAGMVGSIVFTTS
jgi:uncharacterized cupredoxin-like copper-binding protein